MAKASWFIVLLTSFFLVTLLSCSPHASNNALVERLDSSLRKANRAIKRSNADILLSLDIKTRDRITKEKAIIWFAHAKRIDSFALLLLTYIDSLKAGVTKGQKEELNSVHTHLMKFKNVVVPIHERLQNIIAFQTDFHQWRTVVDSQELLRNASSAESTALLTAVQNEILQAENECLQICHEQTAVLTHGSSFEAIVAQNAKVLHVRDWLEITTGVGRLERDPTLKVTINGQKTEVNDRGIVSQKIKTSGKPGNYSLPVSLSFTDEDGKSQTRTFRVEYRLVDY